MSCPEPGIYHDVPFAEYCEWDAMNASTLVDGMHDGEIDASRLESFISGRRVRTPTKDLRFGRALHARLLEPDLFKAEWRISTVCEQPLGSGKNKGEPCGLNASYVGEDGNWYCGKHKGDIYSEPENYVTRDELARIERCRTRAFEHREILALHKHPGSEVSLVFDIQGVRCKGRLDKLVVVENGAIIADPKKVAQDRLTRTQWRRTVYDLKYYIKAAFYIDGVRSLLNVRPHFYWIALEDDEPFNVALFDIDEPTYNAGRIDYTRLLSAYKRGKETGIWPGAFPHAEECGLSQWVLRQYEGQEIE